jgi:hypothetical protein
LASALAVPPREVSGYKRQDGHAISAKGSEISIRIESPSIQVGLAEDSGDR